MIPSLEHPGNTKRLARQQSAVTRFMGIGEWITLSQISRAVGAPEASCSARLREMRRNGWNVERRRVPGGNGLHVYRATPVQEDQRQYTLFP